MRTIIKVLALIGATNALATEQFDDIPEVPGEVGDVVDDVMGDGDAPEDAGDQGDAPEDADDQGDAPEDADDQGDAPEEAQEEPEIMLPELMWNGSMCMAEDGTAHT